MTGIYSLLIEADHVEFVEGDAVESLEGDFRLVHEQAHASTGSRWYFYAKTSLSKPEALRRAQQWYDSSGHSDWPGLARYP